MAKDFQYRNIVLESDPTRNVTCSQIMKQNSIAVENLEKNRVKALAQMMPSFTYDKTKSIVAEDACTIPNQAFATYTEREFNNYPDCVITNQGVPTILSQSRAETDVFQGCAASLKPGTSYKEMIKDVGGFLDSAYYSLDYKTIKKIEALRAEVARLTIERDKTKAEYLAAFARFTESKRVYTEKLVWCNEQVHPEYLAKKQEYDTFFSEKMGEMNAMKGKIEHYRANLSGDYHNRVVTKLQRNIRDLSFVTLYQHVFNANHAKVFGGKVSGAGNAIAIRQSYPILSSLDPYWMRTVSGIAVMPGMKAVLYEMDNYRMAFNNNAAALVFDNSGNVSSGRHVADNVLIHSDFRAIGWNDRLASIVIQGQFRSSVGVDHGGFTANLRAMAPPPPVPQPPPPPPPPQNTSYARPYYQNPIPPPKNNGTCR